MYAFLLLFFLFLALLTLYITYGVQHGKKDRLPFSAIWYRFEPIEKEITLRYICENLIKFYEIIAPFGKNASILYVSHRIAYIVSHKMHGDFIRPLISDGRRRCGRLKVFGRKKARQFL